jgi:hypothetical protein
LVKIYDYFLNHPNVGAMMVLAGKLSHITHCHPPSKSIASRIASIAHMGNRPKTENVILTSEVWEDIRKVVSKMKTRPVRKFVTQGPTYVLYTDASEEFLGVSSGTVHKTLQIKDKTKNILTLEADAVLQAVLAAPTQCCLEIHTDNLSNIFSFQSGVCHRADTQEIITKVFEACLRKDISLILRKIATENNPADLPSRVKQPRCKWEKLFASTKRKPTFTTS